MPNRKSRNIQASLSSPSFFFTKTFVFPTCFTIFRITFVHVVFDDVFVGVFDYDVAFDCEVDFDGVLEGYFDGAFDDYFDGDSEDDFEFD